MGTLLTLFGQWDSMNNSTLRTLQWRLECSGDHEPSSAGYPTRSPARY